MNTTDNRIAMNARIELCPNQSLLVRASGFVMLGTDRDRAQPFVDVTNMSKLSGVSEYRCVRAFRGEA